MKTPNVVIIIMDDLAWGDLSCHGNPYSYTPNLDSLYSQSIRMNHYCSGPLCTPARAALMTGRHPYRTRAIDTYLGRAMIDPQEITLAKVLEDAGYATGLFGKWHLGDCYPMRPNDMGFQQSLMHLGGGLRQPSDIGRGSYFNPDLFLNGKRVSTQGYCTDIFTDAALDFIRENRNNPFMVYLATNAPHTPLEIGEKWKRKYITAGVDPVFSKIYGMVENIDYNVGKILLELERLGLAEDTIVLYTSDHGPCNSARNEQYQQRFNGNLRGSKGSFFRGGVQVPCFWRWPGRWSAAGDISRLANPIDILPTIASACGAKMPSDRKIDGMNLLPLLDGQTSKWPERKICMQWHRGDTPEKYRNAAVISDRYKLYWHAPKVGQEIEGPFLFDIKNDPGEQNDICQNNQNIFKDMNEYYEIWFDDVSNERKDNFSPPKIVAGNPAEPVTVLTWQDWRTYAPQEGWSAENPGRWFIRLDRQGSYEANIELCKPIPEGNLLISCAGRKAEIPINGREISFQVILENLPACDTEFEALIKTPGKTLGIRNAIITLAK